MASSPTKTAAIQIIKGPKNDAKLQEHLEAIQLDLGNPALKQFRFVQALLSYCYTPTCTSTIMDIVVGMCCPSSFQTHLLLPNEEHVFVKAGLACVLVDYLKTELLQGNLAHARVSSVTRLLALFSQLPAFQFDWLKLEGHTILYDILASTQGSVSVKEHCLYTLYFICQSCNAVKQGTPTTTQPLTKGASTLSSPKSDKSGKSAQLLHEAIHMITSNHGFPTIFVQSLNSTIVAIVTPAALTVAEICQERPHHCAALSKISGFHRLLQLFVDPTLQNYMNCMAAITNAIGTMLVLHSLRPLLVTNQCIEVMFYYMEVLEDQAGTRGGGGGGGRGASSSFNTSMDGGGHQHQPRNGTFREGLVKMIYHLSESPQFIEPMLGDSEAHTRLFLFLSSFFPEEDTVRADTVEHTMQLALTSLANICKIEEGRVLFVQSLCFPTLLNVLSHTWVPADLGSWCINVLCEVLPCPSLIPHVVPFIRDDNSDDVTLWFSTVQKPVLSSSLHMMTAVPVDSQTDPEITLLYKSLLLLNKIVDYIIAKRISQGPKPYMHPRMQQQHQDDTDWDLVSLFKDHLQTIILIGSGAHWKARWQANMLLLKLKRSPQSDSSMGLWNNSGISEELVILEKRLLWVNNHMDSLKGILAIQKWWWTLQARKAAKAHNKGTTYNNKNVVPNNHQRIESSYERPPSLEQQGLEGRGLSPPSSGYTSMMPSATSNSERQRSAKKRTSPTHIPTTSNINKPSPNSDGAALKIQTSWRGKAHRERFKSLQQSVQDIGTMMLSSYYSGREEIVDTHNEWWETTLEQWNGGTIVIVSKDLQLEEISKRRLLMRNEQQGRYLLMTFHIGVEELGTRKNIETLASSLKWIIYDKHNAGLNYLSSASNGLVKERTKVQDEEHNARQTLHMMWWIGAKNIGYQLFPLVPLEEMVARRNLMNQRKLQWSYLCPDLLLQQHIIHRRFIEAQYTSALAFLAKKYRDGATEQPVAIPPELIAAPLPPPVSAIAPPIVVAPQGLMSAAPLPVERKQWAAISTQTSTTTPSTAEAYSSTVNLTPRKATTNTTHTQTQLVKLQDSTTSPCTPPQTSRDEEERREEMTLYDTIATNTDPLKMGENTEQRESIILSETKGVNTETAMSDTGTNTRRLSLTHTSSQSSMIPTGHIETQTEIAVTSNATQMSRPSSEHKPKLEEGSQTEKGDTTTTASNTLAVSMNESGTQMSSTSQIEQSCQTEAPPVPVSTTITPTTTTTTLITPSPAPVVKPDTKGVYVQVQLQPSVEIVHKVATPILQKHVGILTNQVELGSTACQTHDVNELMLESVTSRDQILPSTTEAGTQSTLNTNEMHVQVGNVELLNNQMEALKNSVGQFFDAITTLSSTWMFNATNMLSDSITNSHAQRVHQLEEEALANALAPFNDLKVLQIHEFNTRKNYEAGRRYQIGIFQVEKLELQSRHSFIQQREQHVQLLTQHSQKLLLQIAERQPISQRSAARLIHLCSHTSPYSTHTLYNENNGRQPENGDSLNMVYSTTTSNGQMVTSCHPTSVPSVMPSSKFNNREVQMDAIIVWRPVQAVKGWCLSFAHQGAMLASDSKNNLLPAPFASDVKDINLSPFCSTAEDHTQEGMVLPLYINTCGAISPYSLAEFLLLVKFACIVMGPNTILDRFASLLNKLQVQTLWLPWSSIDSNNASCNTKGTTDGTSSHHTKLLLESRKAIMEEEHRWRSLMALWHQCKVAFHNVNDAEDFQRMAIEDDEENKWVAFALKAQYKMMVLTDQNHRNRITTARNDELVEMGATFWTTLQFKAVQEESSKHLLICHLFTLQLTELRMRERLYKIMDDERVRIQYTVEAALVDDEARLAFRSLTRVPRHRIGVGINMAGDNRLISTTERLVEQQIFKRHDIMQNEAKGRMDILAKQVGWLMLVRRQTHTVISKGVRKIQDYQDQIVDLNDTLQKRKKTLLGATTPTGGRQHSSNYALATPEGLLSELGSSTDLSTRDQPSSETRHSNVLPKLPPVQGSSWVLPWDKISTLYEPGIHAGSPTSNGMPAKNINLTPIDTSRLAGKLKESLNLPKDSLTIPDI